MSSPALHTLAEHERQVVLDELRLLAHVQVAIAQARGDARAVREAEEKSLAALTALREQAGETSADDLPTVLLDMSVRHRALERGARGALPDAASPYMAHLRVREGEVERDYLLGKVTFIDTRANVRVVDWRVAPIAQVFYRYREGDPFDHELPGRVVEGVVTARRIVVIERGELVRIIGDGVALERGAAGVWTTRDSLSLASGGAGAAVRPGVLGVGAGKRDRLGPSDLTALLDQQQFAAVNAPPEDALLVLGGAGSGKTTVALHRLARVTASNPHKYPFDLTKVVVPEEGLARLSRRLLAPLGASGAQVQTLDQWAADLTERVFDKKGLALWFDAPAAVVSLKRHPALYASLRERLEGLAYERTEYKRLRSVLNTLLTDRAFLERVVESSDGQLTKRAVDETIRHTMRQLASSSKAQLASITDPAMKEALDGRPLDEGTTEELAGTMDVEDLPIMLFLRAWRADLGGRRYSHLVLDEAEDFSLFELFVFGELLGKRRSVTLAGDEAQQTASSFRDWETSMATLGAKHAATCRLSVSYRCPRPISELARAVLGPLAPSTPLVSARDGAPVGAMHLPTHEQALLTCAGAVSDLLHREPRAGVAVITQDRETAERFYELVSQEPSARLVLEGDFSFEAGIDVTDVDSVKGLEFDYVVVPDATAAAYPMNNDARRRLHVAVTRAAHQLWVVSGGVRSPLVPLDVRG